jgi:hypothetical protein
MSIESYVRRLRWEWPHDRLHGMRIISNLDAARRGALETIWVRLNHLRAHGRATQSTVANLRIEPASTSD